MSRDSDLEIHHRREQSQETEWRQQSQELCPVQTDDYVTVVVVDEKPYVTVLSVENPSQGEGEEVLVYRLPGERLGFGLKFDGGLSNNENVAKVIIQSCANDSPASRTKTSWGHLEPGDQILSIDSTPVWEMTRMDCVRILKESNVVLKLGIRRGSGTVPLNKESEAPPIPPRKCHKRKELGETAAPPQAPQAETYTDLISQENVLIQESESDDTGSSISTVVSRISSAPTTCNSSFSDPRSLNSVDCSSPTTPPANQTFDFDKVLDPFLHLEREFSGTSINESNMFHKLAKASNMLERGSDEMPKPAPRQDRRRPPPPPPPPRTEKPPLSEKPHLPRLIDFVPKDRTDLIAPSPLTPSHLPTVPAPPPASQIPCKPPEDLRLQKGDPPDSTPQVVPDSVSEVVDSKMESRGCETTGDVSPEECRRQGAARAGTGAAGGGAVPKDPDLQPPRHKHRPPSKGVQTTPSSIDLALATANTQTPSSPNLKVTYKSENKKQVEPGKSLWKNDERSERSVRDKILMFSNVQQTSSSLAPSMRVKMKCENKSSIQDPFCYVSSRDASRENAMNSSLDKFVHLYPTYPCNQKPENGTVNEKTKANSNVSEAGKLDSPDQRNYDYSSFSSSLSRALSFSGSSKVHSRSYSFCDVGSGSAPLEKSIEEQRHSSFLALCEQRRRGMSKLRGLVIPEKVLEVPTVQVDDLPIIKTSGCQIAEQLPVETKLDTRFFYFKSECDKSLYSSASWKPEAFDMPKYSPAFKRKSLALHTSSLVSSVASSLNSSREELRSCFTDTSKSFGTCFKSGANVARNAHSAQGQSEPMSLESITSPSVSDVSFEYASNSASPNLLTSSVLGEMSGYKSINENSKTKIEKTRMDEESDNDSAVSSSRSSISPPQSPMPRLPAKMENGNVIISPLNRGEFHLKRSLSSDTTTSSSSNASTLTSGGQASCSSCNEGSSSSSIDNRRVLKPRSVEAINRKNVLSSAKYSSGSDVKYELSSSDESQVPQIPQEEEDQDIAASFALLDQNQTSPYSQDSDASFVLMEKEDKYTVDSCVKDEIQNDLQLHSDGEQAAPLEERFEAEEIIYVENEKKQSIYSFRSEESDTQNVCGTSNNKDENVEIISKGSKSESFCETLEKQNNETVTTSKVPDTAVVKRDLEVVQGSQRYKLNGASGYLHSSSCLTSVQHPRISSVDSTNSDDSCIPNPLTSNLQREQFGSITSLASSTSLISQQELQQLIEEANHTLEDEGNSQEVIVVILHRDIPGGSIGITLAGGADYEAKEITVHKVLTGSPAERDGRIQKGDRILSINGKSMKGLTHYESLAILKAPRPEVVLVISRQVGDEPGEEGGQPRTVRTREPRFQPTPNRGSVREEKWGPPVLVTVKKDGTGLGFSLDGGKDSPYGDLPLTIKKIFTGGCADKCGQLFAGDELVTVNNVDLSQLSRIEAWAMLKKLTNGDVRLNIRRPIN